jgi:DNA ligase (NAD+)
MDIDGLGEKSIVEFFELGWLHGPADIFRLKGHRGELVGRDGWQDKSVDNLLDAIEARVGFDPARFLFGLGIRHVGIVTAKDLMKAFGSIEGLQSAATGRMPRPNSAVEASAVVAEALVDFFTRRTTARNWVVLELARPAAFVRPRARPNGPADDRLPAAGNNEPRRGQGPGSQLGARAAGSVSARPAWSAARAPARSCRRARCPRDRRGQWAEIVADA